MKKKLLFLLLIIFITTLFISINSIKADNLGDAFGNTLSKVAGKKGASYNTSVNSPILIISTVIKTVLSLLGVIFMILMVYGGSIWMTAGGKEDRVNKAKDLIQAAVIGLIIVVAAYAISFFIVSKMTKGILID